mgnify:CR=1 FL=1
MEYGLAKVVSMGEGDDLCNNGRPLIAKRTLELTFSSLIVLIRVKYYIFEAFLSEQQEGRCLHGHGACRIKSCLSFFWVKR